VVEAARQVRAKVLALQCDTETISVGPLRFGVALHVGKILYGNIGGGGRQDFTCIGPAINLAARLEKIAGQLGRTVVGSEKFVSKCPSNWTELGDFPIAGISREEKVFGLQDETPVGE
jgi:adenylate cyclase